MSKDEITVITTMPTALTWDQALALAEGMGGTLASTTYLGYPDDVSFKDYAWIGFHKTPAGWFFMDGSAASPLALNAPSITDGDPTNDPTYAILLEEVIVAFSKHVFVNIFATDLPSDNGLFTATPWMDRIYERLSDRKFSLGDGNDQLDNFSYLETGGRSVINAGAGQDVVSVGGDVKALVYDGEGGDAIEGSDAQVVVSAAIDGDNDWFRNISRLSYSQATTGLTVRVVGNNPWEKTGVVTGGGAGEDRFQFLTELVGGSGDDDLEGVARLQGGAGNDVLRPGGMTGEFGGTGAASAYAEGGDGDDTLYTSSLARTELRGGAGNDTLMLWDEAKVSGGSGADSFVFKAATQVTINDWSPGDFIDISALVSGSLDTLMDDDYLMVRRSGGYTQILLDQNGGGDDYMILAALKGVFGVGMLHDWILT